MVAQGFGILSRFPANTLSRHGGPKLYSVFDTNNGGKVELQFEVCWHSLSNWHRDMGLSPKFYQSKQYGHGSKPFWDRCTHLRTYFSGD